MIGELDHRVGQQRQGPTPPAGRRLGTCSRHQQGFFLAGQLALCTGTRLLTQGPIEVAFHEPTFGPIDGGSAYSDGPGNLFVAAADIGRQ